MSLDKTLLTLTPLRHGLKTWHKIEYRLNILRATNGAHVEVYKWHKRFNS